MALVEPGGNTTVLPEEAVSALAGTLEDTLVITVHGGNTCVGSIQVQTDLDVSLLEDATFSVEARPYHNAAEIRVEMTNARIAWLANIHTLRQLQQMCRQAEQVLLGLVTEHTSPDDGKENPEDQDSPPEDPARTVAQANPDDCGPGTSDAPNVE